MCQGLYIRPKTIQYLLNTINAKHFVFYADDSYLVIINTDLNKAIKEVTKVSTKHIKELERLEKKINVDKTEMVIFKQIKTLLKQKINLESTKVETKQEMKGLGVIFNNHLK